MPDIRIDQVVIGSCTNGRLEDLMVAAEIMRGKKIAPHVRCIIIPATQRIYLDAMEMGLLKTFIEAGCAVSPHLRAVPGRVYGHTGKGRAVRRHHKPQLRGPDGPSRAKCIWRARSGGGLGSGGQDRAGSVI